MGGVCLRLGLMFHSMRGTKVLTSRCVVMSLLMYLDRGHFCVMMGVYLGLYMLGGCNFRIDYLTHFRGDVGHTAVDRNGSGYVNGGLRDNDYLFFMMFF